MSRHPNRDAVVLGHPTLPVREDDRELVAEAIADLLIAALKRAQEEDCDCVATRSNEEGTGAAGTRRRRRAVND